MLSYLVISVESILLAFILQVKIGFQFLFSLTQVQVFHK